MKELESSFDDNTSAMEKNRKKSELLEKSIKNQEKTVDELEKGLKASKEKYGENSTQTQKWQQAVSNAKTELNRLKSELNKIPKPLAEMGQAAQKAGKKLTSIGDKMTKYVTAPLLAVGAASVAAFSEVDDGLDSIAKTTGATGEALEELENIATDIATTIPTSFETAGAAVGAVNTRFGVTGQELEDLTSQFVMFADINDTDVTSSVEGVQKVMAAFGMETKDAGKLLDAMNVAGQKTGVGMDELQTSLVKNSAALQNMGLDAYDAATFLGQVEKSGADSSQIMSGLSKALTNAAEDGKTLPEALGEFQGIMNSTATDQEKLNAAIDLFGKKAGPAIFQACKSGSLSFESLATSADTYIGSVQTTFENVKDPVDDFQVAMNELKALGARVGKTMLTAAVPGIKKVGEKLEDAAEWFGELSEEEQLFAIKTAIGLAAAGPVMSGIGRLTQGIGGVMTAISGWSGVPSLISTFLTNPIALGAIAVGTLIGAVILLDSKTKDVNDNLTDMVTGTNEAIDAMETSSGKLSETLSSAESEIDVINGSADLASDLVDELADLENQTSLTAEQQGRMRTIVGELNEIYPELGLSIDSSTGKLNKSTKSVKEYIEQTRKIKLLEAYQKAATKGYEDLAEAHIALDNANKQSEENMDIINGLLAEQERLCGLTDDGYGKLYDSTGNYVMTAGELETALGNISLDLQEAQARQDQLNTATTEAQGTYDAAKETIASYDQAAADTAAEIEAMTSATEQNTTTANANATAAANDAAAVESWGQRVANATAGVVSGVAGAASEWGSLYTETRDSISKQLNVFDEWEQNSELTFKQMRKNLKSQIEGMNNYAENMGKLSKAATESSDPNFKAFVKNLASMGIDAAGEVQTLVNAMENKPKLFNRYIRRFGEDYQDAIDNIAYIQTYVESDFTNGVEGGVTAVSTAFNSLFGESFTTGMQTFGEKLREAAKQNGMFADSVTEAGKKTDSVITASGKNLERTSKSSTDKATSYTESAVNGMDLEPGVDRIDIPGMVVNTARNTMNGALSNVNGKVSKVNGAAEAGKAAKTTMEGKMNNMTGKVTKVSVASDALSNLRTTISNFLTNNPITTWIKGKLDTTHHAEGGFTYKEQLSWLSEGNQPEVVIPLAPAHRAEAMTLYRQTGEKLGIANHNTTYMTMAAPGQSTASFSLDTAGFYEAVAAAAREGMENANIKIYIGDREAGRILRGMGVQFA